MNAPSGCRRAIHGFCNDPAGESLDPSYLSPSLNVLKSCCSYTNVRSRRAIHLGQSHRLRQPFHSPAPAERLTHLFSPTRSALHSPASQMRSLPFTAPFFPTSLPNQWQGSWLSTRLKVLSLQRAPSCWSGNERNRLYVIYASEVTALQVDYTWL